VIRHSVGCQEGNAEDAESAEKKEQESIPDFPQRSLRSLRFKNGQEHHDTPAFTQLRVCDGGLTEMMPETEIAAIVQRETDPHSACEREAEIQTTSLACQADKTQLPTGRYRPIQNISVGK
jgi:hypothetical protein